MTSEVISSYFTDTEVNNSHSTYHKETTKPFFFNPRISILPFQLLRDRCNLPLTSELANQRAKSTVRRYVEILMMIDLVTDEIELVNGPYKLCIKRKVPAPSIKQISKIFTVFE